MVVVLLVSYKFSYHIQSFLLWVLFIDHQTKVVLLKKLLNFSKINTNDREICILGDFNTNLFSKQKYIFHQANTQLMSHEVKNYFQF